MESQYRQRG